MKTYNTYNRFILYSNAPVCAYGNKIETPRKTRGRKTLLVLVLRLRSMFRDGSRPNRAV